MSCYDKSGNAVTFTEYLALKDVSRIALDAGIRIDGQSVNVSTAWLGCIDDRDRPGPPLIFETLLFVHGDEEHELHDWGRRYSTLADAEAGHAQIAAELRAGRWPDA